jgi:ferrous iron transport protein B
MHRLGLHGLSIIPTLLGLGCNVPGALATRIFETKRQRFIAATLMSVCVPCAAQLAVILALLGPYGWRGYVPLFLTLLLLWVLLALAFKHLLRGAAPEIFIEIPPYRLPPARAIAQKVWLRTRQTLVEAIPFVMLGVLLINILDVLHVLEVVGAIFSPFLKVVLGLPEDAIAALLAGFLRKDVAVGMLSPLNLSLDQLIVACVMLTTYFPCAATFAVLWREFGARYMALATVIMVVVSTATGALLYRLLSLF